jgi:hypothetical protein
MKTSIRLVPDDQICLDYEEGSIYENQYSMICSSVTVHMGKFEDD